MKIKMLMLFFAFNIFLLAQNDKLAKANDDIYSSRQTIITKTVREVSPAVVGINVTEIRQYQDVWSANPFWSQFFAPRIYSQKIKGLGSGVIISSDGYVLTNDHVAGNAVEATVTLTDGRMYTAKKITSDLTSDICLLKIDADKLPYIKFGDSDKIMIGEWVIALGNPFGLFDINDKPTVTVGVLSATDMTLSPSNNRYYVNMLQTDAAINPGNSGGPLVNALGELIGMNTMIYTATGSNGNVGLGFSIPVNKIKRIVEDLKNNGKVDRDFWTGLNIMTVDENFAKTYNLFANRGVIISQLTKGSPAEKAGLAVGDIIVSLGNNKISSYESFLSYIFEYTTGETVDVKFIRGEKEMSCKLKLEKK
ncbi:MAG: Serine protease [Ignavibacteria bacterium]|nr:MAG: Serine protease [Ignavibacteria bacterium]KAF0162406.1 MAG: Serine protease [Ignavibacteria bacterium]